MSVDVSCSPVYYIAGPMRGIKWYNFPAFDEAASQLRSLGVEVFSPADADREIGFNPILLDLTGDEDLREYDFCFRDALARDCAFLCRRATHVYMLNGWANSKGARGEHALALALGLMIEGAAA